jgi:peptidoglycan-associated lipoprotein
MTTNFMTTRAGLARGLFLGAMLTALAACSTTRMEVPGAPEVDPNAGGQTNDPAAGFENVQAGTEQDFILNVGRRIFFAKGSASLDSVAKATLDKQIAFLNQYPSWFAKMQGFADDPGSDAALVTLSQQRADAVMAYLVAGGVAPGRLWSKGYGKDRPVCTRTENECKVQNRRVVVNLQTKRDETM